MGAQLLGSLLVSLGLESSEFDRKIGRSGRNVTGFGKTVQGLNKTMAGLKTGFAVLGASVVTGTIATAAKSGLEYASSLGEVAMQLSVSTRALQEYRYAASQTGVTQDEMDKSLAPGSADLKLAAGESVTFRYRFYIHEGDAEQGKVAERYREYAQ